MTDIYLIDTNILIDDPERIFSFGSGKVFISSVTIEELDKLKDDKEKSEETRYFAKKASRIIDTLRKKGNLLNGVSMENGGFFFVESPEEKDRLPYAWNVKKPDNLILQTGLTIKRKYKNTPTVVTSDTNVRIKAAVLGLKVLEDEAEDDTEKKRSAVRYTGTRVLDVSGDVIERFRTAGEDGKTLKELGLKESFTPNEFIMLRNGPFDNSLGRIKRVNGEEDRIVPLLYSESFPFGIEPHTLTQLFAIEALMQPVEEIPLVILSGISGTGKTFLASACGMEQAWKKKTGGRQYNRILITRTNVTSDEDIGFVKGDETEKMIPLLRGVLNNMAQLEGIETTEEEFCHRHKNDLDMEFFGYLRGRSIPNQYIILDEAQNTTPHQILEFVTRAGKRSKLVICGDLEQIDDDRKAGRNNGLAAVLKEMVGSNLCSVIAFEHRDSSRSALAREATLRMSGGIDREPDDIREKYDCFSEVSLPKKPISQTPVITETLSGKKQLINAREFLAAAREKRKDNSLKEAAAISPSKEEAFDKELDEYLSEMESGVAEISDEITKKGNRKH